MNRSQSSPLSPRPSATRRAGRPSCHSVTGRAPETLSDQVPLATAHAATPASTVDTAQLLTVAMVADQLQVSNRSVRRWIAEDRLPVVRLGRAVRIRPADLAQLIATGLSG